MWGQTIILQNINQTKTTAHVEDILGNPPTFYYNFSSTWDIGSTRSGGNPVIYDYWYSVYKFSLSGVPAGYPIKKVTMTVLVSKCDYYSNTFQVNLCQLDNGTSLTNSQAIINAIGTATSISKSLYQDTITVDITNLVGQRQLYDQFFLLGASSNDVENNSHAQISITVNVEYYLPVTIIADNNFTASNNKDGKIIVNNNSPVDAPANVPNLIIGSNVSLQAVSPQTDNQGYQRVWNTSGVAASISFWQKKVNGVSTVMGNNIQLSHTITPDDWNASYVANLMKVCNITIQNNFIGVGHGNTITVNNNVVGSPSSNNMIVEQNAISAIAYNNVIEINGVDYYFSNWTDSNNNILSINNGVTFNPIANMSYNANFIGYPLYNINFGYDIVVGQPIKMHWTDNPNPNVTYQIWRNIKGGSGPVLIASVGRGVQTYTDYGYLFTGAYKNDLLYYDVRQYYSVEGTYSNTNWQAVYGKIAPKALVNNSLDQGENIISYFVGCYPNPFNPSTTINYQLPEAGLVSLRIFDLMGREVKTLVNEIKEKGSYNISFEASSLSSGVYFYQLRAGDYVSIKKMVLLK